VHQFLRIICTFCKALKNIDRRTLM
jgi:hypothetical protein